MKKNDVFLIIIILLILVPVSVLFLLRETGDKVLIKIDGKVVDTLSLNGISTDGFDFECVINSIATITNIYIIVFKYIDSIFNFFND